MTFLSSNIYNEKQDRICVYALAPSSEVKRSRVLYVLSAQVSSEQRTVLSPVSGICQLEGVGLLK
jgi:hypothetical protein